MKIENEIKNQLMNKYRSELFETEDVNLDEINDLISDEELKTIIQLNNSDMCNLINQKPLNKDEIRKLLVANINFYKLAKRRELTVHGSSFLMKIASAIDYDIDKLYAELSVGLYNRPYRSK